MTTPTTDLLEERIERLILSFEALQTENALLKDAHGRLDQENADLHRCHREAHMRLERLMQRIRAGESLADLVSDPTSQPTQSTSQIESASHKEAALETSA